MTAARIPAHLEVSALLRAAEAAGGFGAVVKRGERDAGVILVLTMERGANARLWERMPRLDGSRTFAAIRSQALESLEEFSQYLQRRTDSDPDAWLIELDIAQPERFIAELAG